MLLNCVVAFCAPLCPPQPATHPDAATNANASQAFCSRVSCNPPLPRLFLHAGLNLSVFLLIGKTSALTMNIAGVVKDWILILLSVVLYG